MVMEHASCSVAEVVETVLLYYMQHGHGITVAEIAELQARSYDAVATVFAHQLSEVTRLGLEPVDDAMLPSDAVWEPTKALLARIGRLHLDGWPSRRIRALIMKGV